MPLHDWSRVTAELFHHFHQDWSIEIARTLNRGRLPKGVAALVEQRAGPRESDVLAIEAKSKRPRSEVDGGVATMPPPVTRFVSRVAAKIRPRWLSTSTTRHSRPRSIASTSGTKYSSSSTTNRCSTGTGRAN
jgi:hypothetical protein